MSPAELKGISETKTAAILAEAEGIPEPGYAITSAEAGADRESPLASAFEPMAATATTVKVTVTPTKAAVLEACWPDSDKECYPCSRSN